MRVIAMSASVFFARLRSSRVSRLEEARISLRGALAVVACLSVAFSTPAGAFSAAPPCPLERLSERAGDARARLNRIVLRAAAQTLPPAHRCGIGFTPALLPRPDAPFHLENEAYREAVVASLAVAAGFLDAAGLDQAARATLVRLGDLMRAYAASPHPETRRDHLLDLLVTAKMLAALGARADATTLIDHAEAAVRARLDSQAESPALLLVAWLRAETGNRTAACALLSAAHGVLGRSQAGRQGAAVPGLLALAGEAHQANCPRLVDRIMAQIGRDAETAADEAAHRQLAFLILRAQLSIGRRDAAAPPDAGPGRAFWGCLDRPDEPCLSALWPGLKSWDDSDLAGYTFLGAMLNYTHAAGNDAAAAGIADHIAARLNALPDPTERLRFLQAALLPLVEAGRSSAAARAERLLAAVQWDDRSGMEHLNASTAASIIATLAPLRGSDGRVLALLRHVLSAGDRGPLDMHRAATLVRVIDSIGTTPDVSLRRQGRDLIGARLAASDRGPLNAAAALFLAEALTRAERFDVAEAVLARVRDADGPGRAAFAPALAVARAFVAARKPIQLRGGFKAPTLTPLLLSGLVQPDGRIGPTIRF